MDGSKPVLTTALCEVLGIEYPILQSGMGGVAGPQLVAGVCNAGALGVLAGTLLPPQVLRSQIREVRELTDRPFGVNLLLLPELREPVGTDGLADDVVAAAHAALQPLRDEMHLPSRAERPPTAPDFIPAALEVVIEERVPVFSVGLGDPGAALTARLHGEGIKTVVMVTSAEDARRVAASGADVIVAQGLEAGGHRSHFDKPLAAPLADLGTVSLVPEVVDAVSTPVAAAGGIIDGRGLVAALALGASGVLMGTRFLVTRESSAPESHKKRLLEVGGEATVVTDGITGRWARVARNRLTEASAASTAPPLPFPAQFFAKTDIVTAATRSDDAEHLPLWGGQSVGRIDALPWAADVVADVVREASRLLDGGLAARVRTTSS